MITVSLALFTVFGVKAEEIRYKGLDDKPGSVTEIRDMDKDWPSPFTNNLAWSDEQFPHYGPTYVAGKVNGANSLLWTPKYNKETVYDNFKTLVLETGCTLCLRHSHNKAAIFNDLRINGEVDIWLAKNGGTMIIGGNINVADGGSVSFRSYDSRCFQIDSNITGGGDVILHTQIGTAAYAISFELNGDNSGHTGKIAVRSTNDNPKFGSNKITRLIIANAYALGGQLSEFTYDALLLMRLSMLTYSGADNLVLSETLNRGIGVGRVGGQLNVSKATGTLTVNWPITLADATLYKIGAGRLVLGAPLRFTSKTDATSANSADSKEFPIEGKNHKVDICEGSLSLTHCDALNGAKIAFSNNTEMVMSIDLPDGDMKRYGMKCTKIAEPFATDVPIKLVESEKGSLTESKYAVALATVKAEYAEEAQEKISVELVDVNNYKLLGVRTVANEKASEEDEETVTLYADILHNGLVISVR